METLRIVLTYLMALLMLVAGITHFIKPKMYLRIVPKVLPFRIPIVYMSGIIEIALGGFLLVEDYRTIAASGILILMILFLPLHVWDIFRERPAFGTRKASVIRLIIQFILIFWGYLIYHLSISIA